MLYQNYDSYNREKVQEAIQGMRVDLSNDLVSPRTGGIRHSVDVLFSLPKKYEFQALVQSYQKRQRLNRDGQLRVARDNDQWSIMAKDPTRADVLMIARIPQEEYTQQEANTICEAFVEILNRWQGDLDVLTKPVAAFRFSTQQGLLLMLACRHRELPQKRIICTTPSFRQGDPGKKDIRHRESHFGIDLLLIHPTTHKAWKDSRSLSPRQLGGSIPIPELSDRYQFVQMDNYGGLIPIGQFGDWD